MGIKIGSGVTGIPVLTEKKIRGKQDTDGRETASQPPLTPSPRLR